MQRSIYFFELFLRNWLNILPDFCLWQTVYKDENGQSVWMEEEHSC